MDEKEAIAHLKWLLDDGILAREDEEPVETILQLLERKNNRIDELEKALIDEEIKNKTKIEELESELYNVNCIIDDYIEERNRLKDILKEDENRHDKENCIDPSIILKILEG